MDNAMILNPVNRTNTAKLGGCEFKRIHTNKIGATIFTFNNPYKKTNVDIVFYGGQLNISEEYGETVQEQNIDYVIQR